MRWLEALRSAVPLAGRERVHSRPRVASAARAASEIRSETSSELRAAPAVSGARGGGLGSATAGAGVYVIAELGLAGIAPVATAKHEEAGRLASAAAAAARATGRDPQEVWREALAEWLLARECAGAQDSALVVPRAGRRAREWLEIDATVAALRGA